MAIGLMALCCPCIQFGQNKRRYEYLHAHGKADPHNGGFLNSGCAMHFCFAIFGLQCIPQVHTNSRVSQVDLITHSLLLVVTSEGGTPSEVEAAETLAHPCSARLVHWSKKVENSSSRRNLSRCDSFGDIIMFFCVIANMIVHLVQRKRSSESLYQGSLLSIFATKFCIKAHPLTHL